MRILVVATEVLLPDTHGGSTHVGELFARLSERHPALLLARRGSSGEGIVPVGLPLRGFPKSLRHVDAMRVLPAALAAARSFAPDVIYERCTSFGLGAVLSRKLDAPLLTMILDERYSWLSLLQASRLVATRLDVIPARVRGKAVRVSWGANAELFRSDVSGAEVRRRYGLGDSPVIAYSGSMKRWHGLNDLIEVAGALASRGIRFLMVGDGPERARLERGIAARGLGDHFVFTGAIPYADVPAHMAAADACVAPFDPSRHGPSRKKGFALDPLKVFEYLAMGLPTITIRSSNIETLFDDRDHLLLVTPRRPDELVDAIRWVLDHPEQARAMGERGRSRVLARHTWRGHADHLIGLFEEMRAERGRCD